MKKIIKNSRKGVTILELVIALTLILIITGAALSMAMTAVEVETEAHSGIEMTSRIESIVECFEFSNTEEEFKNLASRLEFNKDSLILDKNVYTLDKGVYTITIIYRDTKLEINATLKGELIHEITYIKGQ